MTKIANIRILDEVNCIVKDLEIDDHVFLTTKFRYHPDGYYFMPKYKMGLWDGFIPLFNASGRTFLHVLYKVIPILKSRGYKIKLKDERKTLPVTEFEVVTDDYFAHITDPDTEQPYKLRYYQVEGVNELIKNRSGLLIGGTGAGKTLLTAVLCDVHGKHGLKTIVIVPSDDLIDNTLEQFEICKLDVGQYSGSRKDLDHTHVISTWQAIQHNPSIMSQFQMVLVDECHGAQSQVLLELLLKKGCHIAYRFGVTATLPKNELNKQLIFSGLGEVLYEIPAHQLIDEGFLAKPKISILQLEENFKEEYDEYVEEGGIKSYIRFKNDYFGSYTEEKTYLFKNKERNAWIAEYITLLSQRDKGNVFCLVSGKDVGKHLQKLIPGSIFVCGEDKKEDRKRVYNLFKDNDDIVVIATVHIAGVGLNIKRIFHLVYIDIGKSFIRVIQTIGRSLRRAHDKEAVHISDICSDLKTAKKHLKERIKSYKEAKYEYKKRKVEAK